MIEPGNTTDFVNGLRAGKPEARNALVGRAVGRLHRLARRMLGDFERVKRWEDTDDVLNSALVRLLRALDAAPPTSSRHFWRLAALALRRELLDLARRYRGLRGAAGQPLPDGETAETRPLGLPDAAEGPGSLEEWASFHEAAAQLENEERDLFALRWYHGLSPEQAEAELGISRSTGQRRWRRVKLLLHRYWPGAGDDGRATP